MEQQKKGATSDNHEADPFTAFMFGKPRTNDDQESKSHSTDDWIFGRNQRGHTKTESNEDHPTDGLLTNLLNQVNTEEVMKNIDGFIETAQEFKPLWTKLYPHIQNWIKK